MSSTLDLLQNDRSTLTSEQWNLISNMIHVYDEQHSIVQFKYIVNQMYTLPPKLRSKPSNTVYIISQAFGSLQPLIERSRDLYSLSTDTCRALIQHNMYTKGGFNTLFIFRELDLYRNFGIMNAYTALYGYDVAITSARNSDECDPNGNLIKMFIFILLFSENCSSFRFDDEEDIKTMSISMYRIEIQNMYVTAFCFLFVIRCPELNRELPTTVFF